MVSSRNVGSLPIETYRGHSKNLERVERDRLSFNRARPLHHNSKRNPSDREQDVSAMPNASVPCIPFDLPRPASLENHARRTERRGTNWLHHCNV